jgi:hypothetical protein
MHDGYPKGCDGKQAIVRPEGGVRQRAVMAVIGQAKLSARRLSIQTSDHKYVL